MKKHWKLLYTMCFALLWASHISAQKQFILKAPNGKLQAAISVGKTIEYSITHNGDLMLDKSPISMTLVGGGNYGINPKLSAAVPKTVNQTIEASIYKKRKVSDRYNELTLRFVGDYNILFRAYDDGIAYRFVSTSKKPFRVEGEQAVFNFPADEKAYIGYPNTKFENWEQQFYNSFENQYDYTSLTKWDRKRLAFLPLVVEGAKGKKVCITESDLLAYPGMFLSNAEGSKSIKGVFAPYPKETEEGGHNMLQSIVKSRETYIAQYEGGTNFPWRAVIVAEKDYELANSDMVYKLATPCQLSSTGWIKPGKVAWDWWNDWNLHGVDFRTGVNNETYKHYIDFASEKGIEYVILDEGWSVRLKSDLMQVVPEIDLKELTEYANSKRVGLILWAGYNAFARDIEGVCKHYSAMGIKGFKVDFMDRDDQPMVEFFAKSSQIAAKYNLMLNFHGAYKPTGLQRTYPNAINYEGVFGLENMKWDDKADQVTYDVTIPFTRMVAGPMDYTQGAMRNATRANFRAVNSEGMSQGTRCHQLAEYIIFESPLNMLCDNPENYRIEKECTEFIAHVPVVWDETVAINGEISKYVSLARKKGSEWYVGSLNNWDARDLELDLSFLGEGKYRAEIFKDGINADKAARDYKRERIDVPVNRKLTVSMAPGGGFVMRIFRSN